MNCHQDRTAKILISFYMCRDANLMYDISHYGFQHVSIRTCFHQFLIIIISFSLHNILNNLPDLSFIIWHIKNSQYKAVCDLIVDEVKIFFMCFRSAQKNPCILQILIVHDFFCYLQYIFARQNLIHDHNIRFPFQNLLHGFLSTVTYPRNFIPRNRLHDRYKLFHFSFVALYYHYFYIIHNVPPALLPWTTLYLYDTCFGIYFSPQVATAFRLCGTILYHLDIFQAELRRIMSDLCNKKEDDVPSSFFLYARLGSVRIKRVLYISCKLCPGQVLQSYSPSDDPDSS